MISENWAHTVDGLKAVWVGILGTEEKNEWKSAFKLSWAFQGKTQYKINKQ